MVIFAASITTLRKRDVYFGWYRSPRKTNDYSKRSPKPDPALKTKRLLHRKVWWLGIEKQLEELIKVYLACQAQAPLATTEPVKPWQIVYANICGPFLTGRNQP